MSTRDYSLTGFNRITLKFPMEIEVVRSDSFGVTLTGTETQLKNVKVVQNGDQITISYDINLSSILAVPSRGCIRVSPCLTFVSLPFQVPQGFG